MGVVVDSGGGVECPLQNDSGGGNETRPGHASGPKAGGRTQCRASEILQQSRTTQEGEDLLSVLWGGVGKVCPAHVVVAEITVTKSVNQLTIRHSLPLL